MRTAGESVAFAERSHNANMISVAMTHLGTIQTLRAQWPEAVAALERGLHVAREAGTMLNLEAETLAGLGRAYLGQGDLVKALATARETIAMARARGARHHEAAAHIVHADVLLALGGADRGSACTDRTGWTTGDVCQAGVCQGTPRAPWINEFDYDDVAALNDDRDEFVEIAGPAGTDLSGYKVVAVEGADGSCATPLGSTTGNANVAVTLPAGTVLGDDTGTGIGFLVVCFYYTSGYVPGCDVRLPAPFTDSNLQNGHLTNADLFSCPDGILLLDAANGYVDAVSYEGQVPSVGFFGPFFHAQPPYVAERDEGWQPGVSIEKTTSALSRATSAAEWRDPTELGSVLCTGQLGLACPTNTRTPGARNTLQMLACGSPSGAFVSRD